MDTLHNNKTKIVATLGPSSDSVERLIQLIRSGVDVVRLNFSHGTHDDHLKTLRNVHEARERTGTFISVLQDLQGPKIRIGEFNEPHVELRQGGSFTITSEAITGDQQRVSTTYANLPHDVHVGDAILLDDGKVRLRVSEVKGSEVRCEVIVGGTLSAHKGINLPNVAVSTPSLTEKDIHDLDFGIKHDIDYVALSFVRTAEDIRTLRNEIIARIEPSRFLPIVAKVEKPQAIANIDAIIAEADAIMIARGDLGVELPTEDVPMLQKKIIKKCSEAGKPVIIATQMLESMINTPTPTRAEANDVANGVVDGADAVMLSGETSVGKFPLEAVQIMDRIIRRVEMENIEMSRVLDHPASGVSSRHDALGRAACVLAEQMNAAAIVCVTHSGETARVVSRYRPPTRILAITDRAKILRRLNLIWGVRGLVIENLVQDSDKAVKQIRERLLELELVQEGEYIVLLGGQPFFARGSTNFIEVEKVG
ncbi:MAG: pyruvate kinase [Ignavibacteriae bacterium]|nr:pyruvate kinase [Ignavibacteriota bacterium]